MWLIGKMMTAAGKIRPPSTPTDLTVVMLTEHAGILLEFGSRDKRTASVVHIHMAGRDKLVEWNDLNTEEAQTSASGIHVL